MRAPRALRARAAANAQVSRMNEIDRVMAFHMGDADEIVDVSEYHERYTGPAVGFQPNA